MLNVTIAVFSLIVFLFVWTLLDLYVGDKE